MSVVVVWMAGPRIIMDFSALKNKQQKNLSAFPKLFLIITFKFFS